MRETISHNLILLAPGGGPTLTFMDAKIAYKVTDGTWGLLEHTLPPYFAGAPLHWHEVTHQGFYILEGKVRFQLGTQLFSGEPGAFVSVPTRTLHTFSNALSSHSRLLEIIVPGGSENSFKELVALTQVESESLPGTHKLFDIYKRYDTFMPEEN